MPLVYFDSSALVKLLTEEEGSDLAAELWDGCDAALASRLAYPEVRAALAASARNHDLDDGDLAAAERAFEEYWAASRPVELTAAVERHAGLLAGLARAAGRGRRPPRQRPGYRRPRAHRRGLGPAPARWRSCGWPARCPGAARRLDPRHDLRPQRAISCPAGWCEAVQRTACARAVLPRGPQFPHKSADECEESPLASLASSSILACLPEGLRAIDIAERRAGRLWRLAWLAGVRQYH